MNEPRGVYPEADYLGTLRRRLRALIEAEPMAAEAVRIAEALRRVTEYPRSTGYTHGNSGYTGNGCRCPECCEAHAEYQRRYREANPGKHAADMRKRRAS